MIRKFFDKHHKFERFGLLFVCMFVILSSIFVNASVDKYKSDKELKSSVAIYTKNVKTTMTSTDVSVEDIYRSKDKTRAFIVLNFGSESGLSFDANRYKMYMSGASIDSDEVREAALSHSQFLGGIYMFGSSGYAGLYITDAQQFMSEYYYITLVCDSDVSKLSNYYEEQEEKLNETQSETRDNSDKKEKSSWLDDYDVLRLVCNFGASGCKHGKFLDGSRWTIQDAFEECILNPQEKNIRKQLDTRLKKLYSYKLALDEYAQSLDRMSVIVPEYPIQLKDDRFENLNKKTKDETKAVWKYTPKYVYPKGFDFDWRAGSVKKGYIDKLRGDMSIDRYLSGKEQELDNTKDNDVVWRTKSGQLVSELSADSSLNTRIKNITEKVENTWDSYENDKKEYQTNLLKSLLYMEVNLKNLNVDTTVNLKDALKVY